jgi:hypothetical protein
MQEGEGEMGLGYGEYIIREDCLMSSEDERRRGFPSVEKAKEKFLEQAMPCPLCKTPPEQLSWVYMVIPQWACKDAEQNEGWVTICDRCKIQIDFFLEKG